jgi:mycoredoxin
MQRNLTVDEHMTRIVTMYSAEWCGHCRRLKRQLEEAGIDYIEVDIDEHTDFGDRIARHTGGPRTIPTIEISGRLLVNPTVGEVQAAIGNGRS